MLEPVIVPGRMLSIVGHDIKAARTILPLWMLLQKTLCGEHDPFLFGRSNAFQCAAKAGRTAIADLDKYHSGLIKHDQVQLAIAAVPVALYQLQPLANEEF